MISFSGFKNLVTQKPNNVYVLESGGSPHGGMGKFHLARLQMPRYISVIGHKLGN